MTDYTKKACIIGKCPKNGRKRVPYCATCSSTIGRWEVKVTKDPQAVAIRQDTLEKWQNRMTYLGNRDKEYSHVARLIKARRGR